MSGSTLSRVLALIDLNATCAKISRRFGLILAQRGENAAWKYLQEQVDDHHVTKKGFESAKKLYEGNGV